MNNTVKIDTMMYSFGYDIKDDNWKKEVERKIECFCSELENKEKDFYRMELYSGENYTWLEVNICVKFKNEEEENELNEIFDRVDNYDFHDYTEDYRDYIGEINAMLDGEIYPWKN